MSKYFVQTRGQLIAHLNVQGISNKTDELRDMVGNSGVKIMLFTETFLKPHHSSCLYNVPGYREERRDRPSKGGGGVIALVHQSVTYERLSSLDTFLPESVSIMVRNPHASPFLCAVVYRPPNTPASWLLQFDSYLRQAKTHCGEVIVLGDFNIDILGRMPNSLQSVCATHDLTQLIGEPTRVTNTTSTLIDHVYTNDDRTITSCGVIQIGISDHYMTYISRKSGRNRRQDQATCTRRDWSKFNADCYQRDLAQTPWHVINKLADPDQMLAVFTDQLQTVIERHAPMKASRHKLRASPPAWMDEEIRRLIRTRNRLKKSNDPDYRRTRNKVTNLIRVKKKEYTAKLILESGSKDTRKLWDHLLNRTRCDAPITEMREPGSGKLVTDEFAIANCLNEHFSEVAGKLLQGADTSAPRHTDLRQYYGSSNCTPADIPHITPEDVILHICKIPSNKATGHDGLSVKLLQLALPHISHPIATVINQSIQTATFPQQWKIATITPLHKAGDPTSPSNYRPISILPILSKVFERHIKETISKHLVAHNILHPHQSGFRPHHSCDTAITRMYNDWTISQKSKLHTTVVMLDFSKAFDVVDHGITLQKLANIKLPPGTTRLIGSFLEGRQQRVKLGDSKSEYCAVTHGVPQGSILGPLLFAIYINDILALPIQSTIHAFADDTTMYFSHRKEAALSTIIDSDLLTISEWCRTNRMILNIEKSKYMRLSPSIGDNHSPPTMNGIPINRCSRSKLLGFTISEDLRWEAMIANLHAKIKRNNSLLRHLRELIDVPTARAFYSMHISPYLSQGIVIWGNCAPKSKLNSLFLLQKSAIRNINKVSLRDQISSVSLAKKSNILSLPELIEYHSCSLGFRIVTGNAPIYLLELFRDTISRDRRDKRKLPSSTAHSKIFSEILTQFNALPTTIRNRVSQASFRRSLRGRLLGSAGSL